MHTSLNLRICVFGNGFTKSSTETFVNLLSFLPRYSVGMVVHVLLFSQTRLYSEDPGTPFPDNVEKDPDWAPQKEEPKKVCFPWILSTNGRNEPNSTTAYRCMLH